MTRRLDPTNILVWLGGVLFSVAFWAAAIWVVTR
jgi:hypothetical protein